MVNHLPNDWIALTMPASDPRFEVATLDYDHPTLKIVWRDEHVSRFPAVWLLEACACQRCGNTQTAVRHLRLTDKPPDPEIHGYRSADSNLVIDWGEQHASTYDLTWLRSICLCPQSRQQRKFKASYSQLSCRPRRVLLAPAYPIS